MTNKLLLVDFENVQQVDLSKLDDSYQVIIFVGASQKNIPIDLVTNAQKLGNRIEWKKVEGNGSNALDFHIAMQLGRVLEKTPNQSCIVLSKDKGFDPLIKYLIKAGLKTKRINSLLELSAGSIKTDDPNYQRVFDLLSKVEKKNRPRRRKTLIQHISAMFQKKLPQQDIDKIIDMLFANKLISESSNVLSYEF